MKVPQYRYRCPLGNLQPTTPDLDAVKREGPLALYSGFATNLMRILPHYAIVFVLYEQLSYSLSQIID